MQARRREWNKITDLFGFGDPCIEPAMNWYFWLVPLSDVCDWAELDLNQDWYLAILNSSLFGGSILGLKALVVSMSSTNQKSLLKLF